MVTKTVDIVTTTKSAVAQHLDELLDEALDESFPASDPIAISVAPIPAEPRGAAVVVVPGDQPAQASGQPTIVDREMPSKV